MNTASKIAKAYDAKPLPHTLPKQDPKETAQEAVHQVMPKDAAKELVKPAAANDVVNVAPQAAKGDDDLMSQPEKKS